MFKKLIVSLLNRVFGLNLTVDQLDSFIAFINVLIEAFGSVTEATAFAKRTSAKSKAVGRARSKAIFTTMEKTMGEQ